MYSLTTATALGLFRKLDLLQQLLLKGGSVLQRRHSLARLATGGLHYSTVLFVHCSGLAPY